LPISDKRNSCFTYVLQFSLDNSSHSSNLESASNIPDVLSVKLQWLVKTRRGNFKHIVLLAQNPRIVKLLTQCPTDSCAVVNAYSGIAIHDYKNFFRALACRHLNIHQELVIAS